MTKTGFTLWMTGLSGAGKSTLAENLDKRLKQYHQNETSSFILDGDIIRKGLNKNLGFSKEDRAENIRRISEVSKLFNLSGNVTIVAFISPYEEDRKEARRIHSESGLKFSELFVSTPLETCEKRDIKGMYKKARAGEIKNFTGVSDPYEKPTDCELSIDTSNRTIDSCIDEIINHLINHALISNNH